MKYLNVKKLISYLERGGFTFSEDRILRANDTGGMNAVADYLMSVSINPSIPYRFIEIKKQEVVSKFKEQNKEYISKFKDKRKRLVDEGLVGMASFGSSGRFAPGDTITWQSSVAPTGAEQGTEIA